MAFDDFVCSPENNNPVGIGKPMKEDDARKALINYLQDAPMSPDDKRHFFGFTFGLDTLKKFIESIDRHNSKSGTTVDKKVAGVRIYYSKTVRSNPVPPLINGVMYPDLLLVPVLPDGSDYHKNVHPDKNNVTEPDPIILGDSRPCPNQCKLDFLEKKKK